MSSFKYDRILLKCSFFPHNSSLALITLLRRSFLWVEMGIDLSVVKMNLWYEFILEGF